MEYSLENVLIIFGIIFAGISILLGTQIVQNTSDDIKNNSMNESNNTALNSSNKDINLATQDTSGNLFDESYKEKASERYIKDFIKWDRAWTREKEVELSHNGTIYEVDRYRNKSVTSTQIENAWTLYNKSYEAAKSKNWLNYSKALKDGFRNPHSVDHYVNIEYFRDNQSLVPKKPEFLMYRNNSNGEKVLTGMMYMLNNVSAEGRQIGGTTTKWHFHVYNDYDCYYDGYGNSLVKDCPKKYFSFKTPEMMHVWFVDHREGVFATNMAVPQEDIEEGPHKMNKSEFTMEIRKRYGGAN